ncbi:hypothetical protein SteCoe_25440 [Stentor coeruleus]|uniref:Uncharacterized protein n=1 Tax=Stentor coeruleus TaxID=5963 RepID=A0A1R2BF47_9CILI|nr:hypothetical protein SteCoe_25440 [Stentor coeruleus]
MGCKICKRTLQANELNSNNLDFALTKAIIQDDIHQLKDCIKDVYSNYSSDIVFFDSYELKCKNLTLNCLSFCLIIGASKCFKMLLKIGSSLSRMEKILWMQQIDPMRILSAKGYTKIMKAYLPAYLANQRRNSSETFNKQNEDAMWQECYIHTATRYLMLPLVYYFYKNFENSQDVPEEFDVHSQKNALSENCALIACRKGSLPLIKLLYEFCHADFNTKNALGENAVIICLRGFLETKNENFHICIAYLVETVQIDILYRYEEMLFLAEDERTIKYLEKKLESQGILATKLNLPDITLQPIPSINFTFNHKLKEALSLTKNSVFSSSNRNLLM